MNFMEAVKAMKEGKRVRMKTWGAKDVYYIFGTANKIVDDFGDTASFYDDYIEATDWEIYEEKKALSDRIYKYDEQEYIHINFIQQSLKEFVDWVVESHISPEVVKLKAKEKFGERLI